MLWQSRSVCEARHENEYRRCRQPIPNDSYEPIVP